MKIPAPTADSGMTEAEIAAWHRRMRTLDADPRTAGSNNRPAHLVRQVLADARGAR